MVGAHAIGVLRRLCDYQCYFVSFCLPSLHKAQPLSLWIYFLSQKEKFTYAGITNDFVVNNTAIMRAVPTCIRRQVYKVEEATVLNTANSTFESLY